MLTVFLLKGGVLHALDALQSRSGDRSASLASRSFMTGVRFKYVQPGDDEQADGSIGMQRLSV